MLLQEDTDNLKDRSHNLSIQSCLDNILRYKLFFLLQCIYNQQDKFILMALQTRHLLRKTSHLHNTLVYLLHTLHNIALQGMLCNRQQTRLLTQFLVLDLGSRCLAHMGTELRFKQGNNGQLGKEHHHYHQLELSYQHHLCSSNQCHTRPYQLLPSKSLDMRNPVYMGLAKQSLGGRNSLDRMDLQLFLVKKMGLLWLTLLCSNNLHHSHL